MPSSRCALQTRNLRTRRKQRIGFQRRARETRQAACRRSKRDVRCRAPFAKGPQGATRVDARIFCGLFDKYFPMLTLCLSPWICCERPRRKTFITKICISLHRNSKSPTPFIRARNSVEHIGSTGNDSKQPTAASLTAGFQPQAQFAPKSRRLRFAEFRFLSGRANGTTSFDSSLGLERIATFVLPAPIGEPSACETDRTLFRFPNALLVRSSVSVRSNMPVRHMQFRIERRYRKHRAGASQ